MRIKNYIQTVTSVVIELETLEDATEYRDYLRDCGIYSLFPPVNESYLVIVNAESLMEGFIKDNVIPHMGD